MSPPPRRARPTSRFDPRRPGARDRARRLKEGVPVDEETWREIAAAARTVNVLVEA